MSRLLLDDRFAPITSEIGFLELPVRAVVDAYLAWQESIEGKSFEPPELEGAVVGPTYYGPDVPPEPPPLPPGEPVFDVRELEGSIGDALAQLLPLTDISPRRYVFGATESGWTAYFDNGWRGTDAFPPMSVLVEDLGCRGLRVVARRDAALLEVYSPQRTEWLNVERSVGAVLDGDRWTFVDQGRSLPFEDARRYEARRIRDRFTLELLEQYLGELGVRAFDDAFYTAPAFLLQRRRAPYRDEREYSLEEARAADVIPPPLAIPERRGLLGRVRGLLP